MFMYFSFFMESELMPLGLLDWMFIDYIMVVLLLYRTLFASTLVGVEDFT